MNSEQSGTKYHQVISSVEKYINSFLGEEFIISEKRKIQIKEISQYIENKIKFNPPVNLIFICTHNSSRSQFGQIWAQTASEYYKIPNINCFSAGTEVTSFNPRSLMALKNAGFEIEKTESIGNPVYNINYAINKIPIKGFSKIISCEKNPQNNFIAIMTCSDADEACPIVSGADKRFSLTYEDPKKFDNTPEAEKIYNERCKQIAIEMFYLFSNIMKK